MIVFRNLPENRDDWSGKICIPDELSLPEESETGTDAFVQALIEAMSKPMKGGPHG